MSENLFIIKSIRIRDIIRTYFATRGRIRQTPDGSHSVSSHGTVPIIITDEKSVGRVVGFKKNRSFCITGTYSSSLAKTTILQVLIVSSSQGSSIQTRLLSCMVKDNLKFQCGRSFAIERERGEKAAVLIIILFQENKTYSYSCYKEIWATWQAYHHQRQRQHQYEIMQEQ